MTAMKVRPALVVCRSSCCDKDAVICAITSKGAHRKFDIPLTQEDMEKGRLPLSSTIKADKIFQIEKSLVVRPFGRITRKKFREVQTAIHKLISEDKH